MTNFRNQPDFTSFEGQKEAFEMSWNGPVDYSSVSHGSLTAAGLALMLDFGHAITEMDRIVTSEPPKVSKDAGEVIGYYTGDFLVPSDLGDSALLFENSESSNVTLKTSVTLPEGKRLVIDNLPKGSKNDSEYDSANPVPRMQVHIYRNSQGYLVADKVFIDEFGDPVVYKKRALSANIEEDGSVSVDFEECIPDSELGPDILFNDRKQIKLRSPDLSDQYIQLLTTTCTWKEDELKHNNFELTVTTEDDKGAKIELALSELQRNPLPPDFGPVIFKLVDNSVNCVPEN